RSRGGRPRDLRQGARAYRRLPQRCLADDLALPAHDQPLSQSLAQRHPPRGAVAGAGQRGALARPHVGGGSGAAHVPAAVLAPARRRARHGRFPLLRRRDDTRRDRPHPWLLRAYRRESHRASACARGRRCRVHPRGDHPMTSPSNPAIDAGEVFTRQGHLTMLALDRFECGELSTAAVDCIVTHLGECTACAERLALVHETPPLRPPASPRTSSGSRWASAVLATGLAVAATVALAVWLQPQQASRAPLNDGLHNASAYTTTAEPELA